MNLGEPMQRLVDAVAAPDGPMISMTKADACAIGMELLRLRTALAETKECMRRSDEVVTIGAQEKYRVDGLLTKAEAELARVAGDAARLKYLHDHPKQAQAFFWNYQGRKERNAAIDAAMGRTGDSTDAPSPTPGTR